MRGVLVVIAVAVLGVLSSGDARAEDGDAAPGEAPEGEEPRPAPVERSAAKESFDQALEHYRAGRYGAAIADLKAALVLDPESKDLLYNLALVHEKLGQLDQAISALERYVALESDREEVRRAEQAILRMRGARAEFARAAGESQKAPKPAPAAPSRVDGWLIATSSIAVAAAAVGVVFGIRALMLRPGSDAQTGPDTSIEDLRDQQERASNAALVADIGFAVSLLAGATTAALWIGRTPDCPHPQAEDARLGFSWGGSF